MGRAGAAIRIKASRGREVREARQGKRAKQQDKAPQRESQQLKAADSPFLQHRPYVDVAVVHSLLTASVRSATARSSEILFFRRLNARQTPITTT